MERHPFVKYKDYLYIKADPPPMGGQTTFLCNFAIHQLIELVLLCEALELSFKPQHPYHTMRTGLTAGA